jgi:hypothetical protein
MSQKYFTRNYLVQIYFGFFTAYVYNEKNWLFADGASLSQKKTGSANRKSENHLKDWVSKSQIHKLSHLRKVCNLQNI